jgi:hypothetical protein
MSELEGVRTWLRQTGLPFEFDVGSAFRDAGFEVDQGIHYRADDPEAAGSREIDVLAARVQLVAQRPMTRATVLFVIECKTATQPWLILRGESEGGKWEATGRFPMNHVSETDVLGALEWEEDPWLLRLPPNHGFRVMATWNGGNARVRDQPSAAERKASRDPAFDAVRQAVSAAEGLLHADPRHLATLAVPVLVVSSALYAVRFEQGREVIDPVSWERVLWRGHRSAEARAIDVVAGAAVSEYARLASEGADEFLPILRRATLVRRDDEMQRDGRDDGVLDRAVLTGEDVVSSVGHAFARARRLIASRLR